MKRENKEELQDTERERVRKKNRRSNGLSIVLLVCALIVVGGLGYVLYCNLRDFLDSQVVDEDSNGDEPLMPEAKVVNEDHSNPISTRMKEYLVLLEGDLRDLGLVMERAVLPSGMMREIDIDIEGIKPYFKVSIDRKTAVVAEDIFRMKKYVDENKIEAEYVDVRVDGRAFYK